ncbi:MAG: hypothetical protein K6F01_12450 [Selenomonas sp.]|uniref:hypothetical protein n=1 Tax=Selenomonas sp. TaxID=2053611 RepID=UPI0025CD964F|nr:hypothetical protein [Selenomonas sp.]MCR5440225.1 hypothetical protein [Selenomonas sp.]
MSGICEPIAEGVSIMNETGGIFIYLKPGDEWDFKPDKKHGDRLLVRNGYDIAISMTVKKFYETFKITKRKEAIA